MNFDMLRNDSSEMFKRGLGEEMFARHAINHRPPRARKRPRHLQRGLLRRLSLAHERSSRSSRGVALTPAPAP